MDRLTGYGMSIREALPSADLIRLAQDAEAAGMASVWLPEFAVRESFTQLGYLAARTDTLFLAPGVAPIAARTPVMTAMAAATLEALSVGRAILGLGVSHPSMNEDWHDQHPRSLLTWAEEYVRVVRAVLQGETTAFTGQEVRSEDFELLGEPAPRVPIVLAALGPRMLELAGRVADGVLLNWTTPDYAKEARQRVAAGAAAAGREPPPIGAYVRLASGPNADADAREHTRFYVSLGAYERSLRRMGFEGTTMTDDAADALILRGSAGEVVDRISAWRDAGVDPVVLYPVGDTRAGIELGLEVARYDSREQGGRT